MTTARPGLGPRRRLKVTYAVFAAALAISEADTGSKPGPDKVARLVEEQLEAHGLQGVIARMAELHHDSQYGTNRMVWALRTVRLSWLRLSM